VGDGADQRSIWRTGYSAISAMTGHGVRRVFTPRWVLAGIAALACTAGVTTAVSSASSVSAQAARCGVGTGGPVIKYPTIYAFGRFCTPVRRTDNATVVLQGRINGKWTRITGVTKQLHMRPGRTYILTTPAIHCTATTQSMRMRTHVVLNAGPPWGTVVLSNSGIPTTCISSPASGTP
jgi:hypothetical protein